MNKSELRSFIKEVLNEELNHKKKLKESYTDVKPFSSDELEDLFDTYNSNYAGEDISSIMDGHYPLITGSYYAYDDTNCDVIIKLAEAIRPEIALIVLFRLFENYTGGDFDEMLEACWQDTPNSIAFWYGRLENLGIETGLSDKE